MPRKYGAPYRFNSYQKGSPVRFPIRPYYPRPSGGWKSVLASKVREYAPKVGTWLWTKLKDPSVRSTIIDLFPRMFGGKGGKGFISPFDGVFTTLATQPNRRMVVANKGVGFLSTKYTFGKEKYNEAWMKNGQKYVWNQITPFNCFKLTNNGTQNGVASRQFGTYETIYDCYSQLWAGSGTSGNLTDDINLSGKQGVLGMYFSNRTYNIKLTSTSNANLKLRIYTLVAKKHSLQTFFADPVEAWKTGVDAQGGVNTSTTYLHQGIFPGHSPYFRNYWAVEDILDLQLPAGASHVHDVRFNDNVVIPNSTWLFDGTYLPTCCYPGFTRSFLFVLEGTPAHDATTETLVGYASGGVDVVIRENIEYYDKNGTYPYLVSSVNTDTVTTPEILSDSDFTENPVLS